MAQLTTAEAAMLWEPTYIGYSLKDMTKWWVPARWGDERLMYPEDSDYAMPDMDYSHAWWQVWVRGEKSLMYEVLGDGGYCFDNYQECRQYCQDVNRSLAWRSARKEHEFFHPLNIGDYIRWEDKQIDNHRLRRLADPLYKASQRFIAIRPTDDAMSPYGERKVKHDKGY